MKTIAKLGLVVAIIAALVLVYFIAGNRDASDIEVGVISPEWPQYPATAIPYSLTRKTFILTTTTIVTGCTDTPDGEAIRGTTDLAITARVGIDPEQQYYIYFESGSRAKNLDYSVDVYDNGALKDLSVSIKDQVAPIAAAALGSLVHLAEIAPALVGAPAPAPPPPPDCAALTTAIKQNPKDPRLILRQEDAWTPEAGDQTAISDAVVVGLYRLATQFRLGNPRWAAPNAIVALEAPDNIPGESSEINFVPDPCPKGAETCQRKPPLVKGLVLRNAVRARMTARICDAACGGSGILTDLPSSDETIPQFGRRFLIPVHSGFAQDAALDVAMNADGLITRLRAQSVSALGDSITKLGGQVGDLASGLETATAAANKALADCLAAQKQVSGAGGSPIGTCR